MAWDGTNSAGGGGGGVTSVNGDTGPAVVLDAADVGAVPTTRTVNGQALSSNVTIATGGIAGYCGDGSDGNVTVSTSITLTRDMFYDTLTVTSTGDLRNGGFRIHCKTLLEVQAGGAVHCNGSNGIGNTGGSTPAAGTLSGGSAGGNSSSGAGVNGGTGTAAGTGGKGGNAPGGSGGNGGTVNTLAVNNGDLRSLPQAALGALFGGSSTRANANGSSGGGGAGNGAGGAGGGGGSGGGFLIINARAVINNGTISANGGNGVNASNVNTAGGGGGGGGTAIVNTESFAGNTPTATGGTAGTGNGTGAAGVAGTTGQVRVNVWT